MRYQPYGSKTYTHTNINHTRQKTKQRVQEKTHKQALYKAKTHTQTKREREGRETGGAEERRRVENSQTILTHRRRVRRLVHRVEEQWNGLFGEEKEAATVGGVRTARACQ